MIRNYLLLFLSLLALISLSGCKADLKTKSTELPLLPYPQDLTLLKGQFIPPDDIAIRTSGISIDSDPVLFQQLEKSVQNAYGLSISIVESGRSDIWIGIPDRDREFRLICEEESIIPDNNLGDEGYMLKITADRILISANTSRGLFYGVQTLRQLLREFQGKVGIPAMLVTDWPAIPVRTIMDDISRGPIPTNAYVKDQIRRYSELKINHMSFYIEHVVETEKHPGFAPTDGSITIEEFRELSEYAADYHIQLIGSFQSLGHAEKILSNPEFRHLGATDRMFDPMNPELIDFLRDVYREMAPAFSSEWFTPNCDEAWDLSRAELTGEAKQLGVARIYADHISRIDSTLAELGKRTVIWGDIILEFPEILDLLPENILIGAWNYDAAESYAEFIDPIRDAGFEFTVSPGILNSNRLFPDYRQAMVNIRNFINEGHEKGAAGVYCTVWDDGGPHFFNHDWYGIAYTADQCWRPNRDSVQFFDERFSRSFYADRSNSIPRGIRELNKLTDLGPTYEMNELIFGKIFIPEPGNSISYNLEEWDEVNNIAKSASLFFDEGEIGRHSQDLASLRFVCSQYQFLADSRFALIEASRQYKQALSLGLDEKENILELLEKARSIVENQSISFSNLFSEFDLLWEMESRPHWYTEATELYDRNHQSFETLLMQLDKTIAIYKSGKTLPPARQIMLDIREHTGQYFQYWLICGPFSISNSEEAAMDFLESMGGESEAMPFPGMEITVNNDIKFGWHKYDSPYRHFVDLNKACPTEEKAVGYAYCTLDSPEEKTFVASLEVSGGVSVFCNGEIIFESYGAVYQQPGGYKLNLPLNRGRNHILLKIERANTKWDLSFKLDEEDIRNHKQKYYIQ